jgi:DNA uptake protein ComE-like DNA-binding protein
VASDSVFKALGLSPNLSSRIQNYTAKGGEFRKDRDLLKIYGMDSTWYKRVEPYIQIAPKDHPKEKASPVKKIRSFDINRDNLETLRASGLKPWEAKRIINYRNKVGPFSAKRELFKLYGFDSLRVEEMLPFVQIDKLIDSSGFEKAEVVLVEINSADSLTLIKIKGIGPSFSKRILKYRTNLGGFVREGQLLEVYGLNFEKLESIKDQIYIDLDKVKKLNVNKASFKTLLKHPYLEYEQVKSIVQFREKVRPFESLEELKNIDGISLGLYEKLFPYLSVN